MLRLKELVSEVDLVSEEVLAFTLLSSETIQDSSGFLILTQRTHYKHYLTFHLDERSLLPILGIRIHELTHIVSLSQFDQLDSIKDKM